MYADIMNMMGIRPAPRQQPTPAIPAGMSEEEWLRMQRLQQLSMSSANRETLDRPTMVADLSSILSKYGQTDVLSPMARASLARDLGEDTQRVPESNPLPPPTIQQHSTKTVDPEAVRAYLKRRDEADRKITEEKAAATRVVGGVQAKDDAEKERLLAERHERARRIMESMR